MDVVREEGKGLGLDTPSLKNLEDKMKPTKEAEKEQVCKTGGKRE